MIQYALKLVGSHYYYLGKHSYDTVPRLWRKRCYAEKAAKATIQKLEIVEFEIKIKEEEKIQNPFD